MERSIASLALLFVISTLIWIWKKKVFSYWKNCGVNTPPFSYIWGHLRTPFLQGSSLGDRIKLIYNYFNSQNMKHGGFYVLHAPWYVPLDLDVCKAILQTDFRYFVDRGGRVIEGEPLTAHLLNLKGKKWKMMRNKLTPTFSSGKIKMMFDTLLDCTYSLKKIMDELEGEDVDIKDILGRLTTDVIGSCAFGIECNSLENPSNEFRLKGKAVFEKPRHFWRSMYELLFSFFPSLMRLLRMRFTNQDIENFFVGIVKETVDHREKNNVKRKDLMDLLIQLKNKNGCADQLKRKEEILNEKNERLSVEEIAGEAFLFFEAGFETSSTAMTFCLYELAQNKDIQERLRQEINSVLGKYGGKVTYEAVMDMPYLDMVLQETLRKYPPVPAFVRVCTERYKIPGTNIVLEEGSSVLVPVYGIHHDPQYYPDPEEFDPARFSDESKRSRHPLAYLPFGEGPRMCIGMRFGLMEAKVGILALLKNYEFEVSGKTQSPLKWSGKNFILSAVGEIWLRHKKIIEN